MKIIKHSIKRLLFFYHSLSILKKFLLAPLFGIIFVFPLYEISCDNVLLLEKIVNDINSAVSAKEPEWINYSDKNADKIRENLKNNRSKKYNKDIKETTEAFNEYYKT